MEYKTVGEAREIILRDTTVKEYFVYLGLFTKEISKILRSKEVMLREGKMRFLFPNIHADVLTERIGGQNYKLKSANPHLKRKLYPNRTYPGSNIYFIPIFFANYSGYPRVIYELLDSTPRAPIINVLEKIAGKGRIRIADLRFKYHHLHNHLERLQDLGLAEVDGKTAAPSEVTRRIFSTKVTDIWEKFKCSEFRIDVW